MASVVSHQAPRRQEDPNIPQPFSTVGKAKQPMLPPLTAFMPPPRAYGIYDEVLRQDAERQARASPAKTVLPNSTPIRDTAGKASPGPPQTSVTKHVHGMLDDMMEEVFVARGCDGQGCDEEADGLMEKTSRRLDLSLSQAECGSEQAFTIPALPSPTRQKHHVVLDLDAMSPLLKEMREIDVFGGSGELEAGAVEIEPQQGNDGGIDEDANVKRVPSLIRYFQDQMKERQRGGGAKVAFVPTPGSMATNKAVETGDGRIETNHTRGTSKLASSSKKPPLLPTHHSCHGSQATQGPLWEFLDFLGLKDIFDQLVTLATRATQGRRKMLAIIILSYLVLLHVFLISGRL